MPVAALAVSDLDARTLAWLEARAGAEQPLLLHSAGPCDDDARFHIMAARPRFVVQGSLVRDAGAGPGRIEVVRDGETEEEADWDDLMPLLRRLEREAKESGAPRGAGWTPFHSGFAGYFGYDLAWLFEYGLPRFQPPGSPLPDLWLGWYERPLIADRAAGTVSGERPELDEFLALRTPREPEPVKVVASRGLFHREEYEAAVERIREHCLRGDIFQADLSRRISLEIEGSPIHLFKQLVRASPAAFMAYVGLGPERAVLSSSPEEFLRLRGPAARTRPIKGTRPRGRLASEDQRLAAELLASEKDLAELTMIVDLMRNDLGRVAAPGSVRVAQFPVLMRLPQVFHLCATVEAELEPGRDFWDLLAASFPPGSISGAPKPKAIEILEIVERSRRGVYTGAIGYHDPDGSAHFNVAIRTAEFGRGRLRFGVGGGVTALSDPSLEFEETTDKARGLALALGLEELR